jgi:hypothetical protein
MDRKSKHNMDYKLFTDIINHLVYHTTKDAYGTTRSRGIETYGHLAEELNDQGIVPDRGFWTENSLKLFFPRVMNRYPDEFQYDDCDLDYVGRSAWEHQSYSKYEELMDSPHRISKKTEYSYTKPSPVYTYTFTDNQKWKTGEIEEIINEEKNVIKKYKKFQKQTRKAKS